MISQPSAPNPYATAAAQGAINRDSAITSQYLSMMNQITPDGNLVYNQTGYWPDGTPRTDVIQTLSPANQQLHDINQQTQLSLANIGQQQAGQIGTLLSTPFDMSQAAIDGRMAGMPALPSFRGGPAAYGSDGDPYAGALSSGLDAVQAAAQRVGPDAPQARYTQAMDANSPLAGQLYDAAFSRFQPQLDRQRQDLDTSLVNRGLRPGSTGYETAMQGRDQAENDLRTQTFLQGQGQAFGQDLQANAQNYGQDMSNAQYGMAQDGQRFSQAQGALDAVRQAQSTAFQQGMARDQFGVAQDQFNYGAGMSGRQQALNELLTQRQTPMNEITSLLSGAQVARPQWTATPTATVQPANLEGLVQSNYQQQMQSYNGLMGGLASLGGTAARGLFALSDERAKRDVRLLARLPNGLGLYSYRFADGRREIGLLAQEVAFRDPGAVMIRDDGLMAVDYARALEAA